MFKVVLVTDSLSLPRAIPEQCMYEQTYPHLLRKFFHKEVEFIHIGRGGYTIKQLWYQEITYWKNATVDLVFLQSGIVDCAPRTLKKLELSILLRIPFLLKIIQKNAALIRKIRKLRYLSVEEYRKILELFKEFYGDRLYFIEIIKPSLKYEKDVPGIIESVTQYNAVAKNIGLHVLSTDEFSENDMMSDFHHLNSSGHYKIFENIKLAIEAMMMNREDISNN